MAARDFHIKSLVFIRSFSGRPEDAPWNIIREIAGSWRAVNRRSVFAPNAIANLFSSVGTPAQAGLRFPASLWIGEDAINPLAGLNAGFLIWRCGVNPFPRY